MPSLTLSPTLTRISRTVPDEGAGTSIVALSLSSVMSESSFLTASPGFTSTSITGTSLKSPMSGTFTSIAAKSRLLLVLFSPLPRAHTVQGAGLSGSMPYLRIASATFAGGIVPSSASALSAASTT